MNALTTPTKVEPMEAALSLLAAVEYSLRGRRPETLRRAIVLLELAARSTDRTGGAGDLSAALACVDETALELGARRGSAEVDHAQGVTFLGRGRNGPRELSHIIVTLAVARRFVVRLMASTRPVVRPARRARASGAPKGTRGGRTRQRGA